MKLQRLCYIDAVNCIHRAQTICLSLRTQQDESKQKAVPPTTCMEFLGNTLDSNKVTIEVSEKRLNDLLHEIDEWFKFQFVTRKQLESMIGKLSFITNCVKAARVFISRLINSRYVQEK